MKFEAIKLIYPEAACITQAEDTWAAVGADGAHINIDETLVAAEAARLQAEYDANAYKAQRAAEYPPITDYLDGVVKGDQAQIDAYIAACQAVKAKYPKE